MYQFDWCFDFVDALDALIPALLLFLFVLSCRAALDFILFVFSELTVMVSGKRLIMLLRSFSFYRLRIGFNSSQGRLRLFRLLHGCLEIHFLRIKFNSSVRFGRRGFGS